MSALDVAVNEEGIMVSEGDSSFRVQTYQPEIMFPRVSKLHVFCFIPVSTSYWGGLLLVSAKNIEDAKTKIKVHSGSTRFIGEVSSLQELLEVLTPYRKKTSIKRKDVWDFLHIE